jgi:hypothetical protein
MVYSSDKIYSFGDYQFRFSKKDNKWKMLSGADLWYDMGDGAMKDALNHIKKLERRIEEKNRTN